MVALCALLALSDGADSSLPALRHPRSLAYWLVSTPLIDHDPSRTLSDIKPQIEDLVADSGRGLASLEVPQLKVRRTLAKREGSGQGADAPPPTVISHSARRPLTTPAYLPAASLIGSPSRVRSTRSSPCPRACRKQTRSSQRPFRSCSTRCGRCSATMPPSSKAIRASMTGRSKSTSSPRAGRAAGSGIAGGGRLMARWSTLSRASTRSVFSPTWRSHLIRSADDWLPHASRRKELTSIDNIQKSRLQSYNLAKGHLTSLQRKMTSVEPGQRSSDLRAS